MIQIKLTAIAFAWKNVVRNVWRKRRESDTPAAEAAAATRPVCVVPYTRRYSHMLPPLIWCEINTLLFTHSTARALILNANKDNNRKVTTSHTHISLNEWFQHVCRVSTADVCARTNFHSPTPSYTNEEKKRAKEWKKHKKIEIKIQNVSVE